MTGITEPASRTSHCQSCPLYLTIVKKESRKTTWLLLQGLTCQ